MAGAAPTDHETGDRSVRRGGPCTGRGGRARGAVRPTCRTSRMPRAAAPPVAPHPWGGARQRPARWTPGWTVREGGVELLVTAPPTPSRCRAVRPMGPAGRGGPPCSATACAKLPALVGGDRAVRRAPALPGGRTPGPHRRAGGRLGGTGARPHRARRQPAQRQAPAGPPLAAPAAGRGGARGRPHHGPRPQAPATAGWRRGGDTRRRWGPWRRRASSPSTTSSPRGTCDRERGATTLTNGTDAPGSGGGSNAGRGSASTSPSPRRRPDERFSRQRVAGNTLEWECHRPDSVFPSQGGRPVERAIRALEIKRHDFTAPAARPPTR